MKNMKINYPTGCALDYLYFKENYKLIATGFVKQQGLDADSEAIQQIGFIGNLERAGSTKMFFILEEVKYSL